MFSGVSAENMKKNELRALSAHFYNLVTMSKLFLPH